jgi:hypothetical protein
MDARFAWQVQGLIYALYESRHMTSQTIRKLNNVEHDAYGYALA